MLSYSCCCSCFCSPCCIYIFCFALWTLRQLNPNDQLTCWWKKLGRAQAIVFKVCFHLYANYVSSRRVSSMSKRVHRNDMIHWTLHTVGSGKVYIGMTVQYTNFVWAFTNINHDVLSVNTMLLVWQWSCFLVQSCTARYSISCIYCVVFIEWLFIEWRVGDGAGFRRRKRGEHWSKYSCTV